jgi:alpha-galactosidase
MQGGQLHDPTAKRIEAYRRVMQAILRGTGDSFILGCNHPIWPSLGLIHGSRSSNDIKRSWDRVKTTAQQNLSRNWQNGRLWWNGPDAVVLTGQLSEDEFGFHATAIYAAGGMVLSGDDLTKISPERLAILRKLLPPTGVASIFQDETLRVGEVTLADARVISLFNWSDDLQTVSVRLPSACRITDYWSGKSLGEFQGVFTARDMPPHSAALLIAKNV